MEFKDSSSLMEITFPYVVKGFDYA